jgi:hypothetical protein
VQFPAIEPYESGFLDVGDGHEVYWESCGNPAGIPALFLHGGPGSNCSAGQRRFFDPSLYRAVLFDQRGSGRSRPLAGSPDACLSYDVSSPVVTAWRLSRQWTTSRLHILDDAGHGGGNEFTLGAWCLERVCCAVVGYCGCAASYPCRQFGANWTTCLGTGSAGLGQPGRSEETSGMYALRLIAAE